MGIVHEGFKLIRHLKNTHRKESFRTKIMIVRSKVEVDWFLPSLSHSAGHSQPYLSYNTFLNPWAANESQSPYNLKSNPDFEHLPLSHIPKLT
ncbi:hypothetical protein TNCT_40951 [Trichonephila clavata]|uniref:Uncharacterized protein n=1 Tax=Trichonephila clavata TaxID=2740835 RepID=A0A8X6KZX0_TRICU|nr:hypothetical protein TNCT_40951 [Trichonephila clavata]